MILLIFGERESRVVQAYKFNPGFQSDTEAVFNFVVRQAERRSILDPFGNPRAVPRVLGLARRVGENHRFQRAPDRLQAVQPASR